MFAVSGGTKKRIHLPRHAVGIFIFSLAAVFWDVTQCFRQRSFGGELCATSQKTAARETSMFRARNEKSYPVDQDE